MQQSAYHSIAENPKFKELVRSRTIFAWTLSILMLLVYQAFILLVAYAPGFLAKPLWAGLGCNHWHPDRPRRHRFRLYRHGNLRRPGEQPL